MGNHFTQYHPMVLDPTQVIFHWASAPILHCNYSSKKIVYLRCTLAKPQYPSFAEIPSPKKLYIFAAPTLSLSIHPSPKFHLQKNCIPLLHPHQASVSILHRNPSPKELFTFTAPLPSLSIHPSLEFPSPKDYFS